jgi:hypothetical protein
LGVRLSSPACLILTISPARHTLQIIPTFPSKAILQEALLECGGMVLRSSTTLSLIPINPLPTKYTSTSLLLDSLREALSHQQVVTTAEALTAPSSIPPRGPPLLDPTKYIGQAQEVHESHKGLLNWTGDCKIYIMRSKPRHICMAPNSTANILHMPTITLPTRITDRSMFHTATQCQCPLILQLRLFPLDQRRIRMLAWVFEAYF